MKTDDLRASLERAKEKGETLNKETTRLNDRLREVEEFLVGAKLGVYAEVSLMDPSSAFQECPGELVFAKWNDRWGLHVRGANLEKRYPGTPVLSASRKERIASAYVLELLVDELIETVEEETARVNDAIKDVEKLLVAMRGER
jgi:hypothetical protein